VTGEYDGLTDTATLYVEHAAAVSIQVTPDPATVTAGDSVTYHATAGDAHGNTWDVTAQTTFSIETGAGGSWTDNTYTSETAGGWTVTGQYNDLADTALLHVIEGEIVSIELTPADETVIAGGSVTYTVTAEDTYGNTWDVTAQTTFSIETGAGGSWTDDIYTSETAGDWIVTGQYSDLSNTATLHVEHAAAASIELAPTDETVIAGGSVTYTVTAEDTYGNTWDVTAQTTFSIEPGAGGSWTGNTYTSETAGDWIVTGQYGDLANTATLHVEHSTAVSIQVTPDPATVTAGDSVMYTVTAEDAHGNTWDVTAQTTFSIETGAGGSWTDNIYTSETAGDWIVTGQYGDRSNTATLHVEHATAASIELAPADETVIAGDSVTYTVTAEDAHGNTWDVTAQTTFSIETGAGGSWTDNTYTSETAGDWIVTGEYNGLTDTGTLHVAAPAPTGSTIYLPLILNRHTLPTPDLVVERIAATRNSVEVVIRNQGDAPVLPTEPFWVDLYVNPHPTPMGVNQTWQSLCSEGMVWGVTEPALPLEPGGTLTLTIDDAYYWPVHSNFSGSFLAGARIYVQVDSANTDTTYGAVLESHEIAGGPYNNISGPVYPTSGAGGKPAQAEPPAMGDHPPASSRHLPPRP